MSEYQYIYRENPDKANAELHNKLDQHKFHTELAQKIGQFSDAIWHSFESRDVSQFQDEMQQYVVFDDANSHPVQVLLVYRDVQLGYIDLKDLDNIRWVTESKWKQQIKTD